MLLALVQQQRSHVIAIDRSPRQVQMTVTQRLEDAEAAPPASGPRSQQHRLSRVERHHPGISLSCSSGRRRVVTRLPGSVGTLLRQQIETPPPNLPATDATPPPS